jgi:glycine/D-amino acid oxidase-like deaminating enzyme
LHFVAGATQEFKEGESLDAEKVVAELKEKTSPFASSLWNDCTIDKITSGYRVQSNRNNYGRIPIIGRFDTPIHNNAWIFTGLGSKGLLYHGVYGDMLTTMMLNLDGKEVERSYLNWWQKKKNR